MKAKIFDYENAGANLRRVFGDNFGGSTITIYTVCDHVSKSGMSRNIKCFVVWNGEVINLGYGRVSGCGMDMGYHVAEGVFSTAYPQAKSENLVFIHRWV